MLNRILHWSIAHRVIIVILAVLFSLVGSYNLRQMPLDVFPDFAPPQVEIQTEAPGLAPEDVEALITLPIERAMNGIAGVTTVRSTSIAGTSAVQVIFSWDTDVYQARQLITERLQQVQDQLPGGSEMPHLSPLSSPPGHYFAICHDGRGNLLDGVMAICRPPSQTPIAGSSRCDPNYPLRRGSTPISGLGRP